MAKILLSLTPIAASRWETHPDTGIRFNVAAMTSEREAEIERECSDVMGNLNRQLFNAKVCAEVLKGWEGIGDKGQEVPCNAENIALFAQHHGLTLGGWVARKARSLDHYRQEELKAAKNA